MKRHTKYIASIGCLIPVTLLLIIFIKEAIHTDFFTRNWHTENAVAEIIDSGRLAPLPESASEILSYAWVGLFTGKSFLTFKASPGQINYWLQNCSSLKSVEPQLHNSADPLIRPQASDAPSWFTPSLEIKGRYFEIPAVEQHNWGEIIINDHTNQVFVSITWS
ncbi:hypothetical protein VSU19_09730 [Verrucomicrobiales bacterium BCK34]|nr:hypothetical protein [Verrucomicrobiales bacterium BCK34]